MMKNDEKWRVLGRISSGIGWRKKDQANYEVRGKVVHMRFCSTDRSNSPHYKFNVNPNTLRADYEVWICGRNGYYLIPTEVMRTIYDDTASYVDKLHPNIRVVSVDVGKHKATYATLGKSIDLQKYLSGWI